MKSFILEDKAFRSAMHLHCLTFECSLEVY